MTSDEIVLWLIMIIQMTTIAINMAIDRRHKNAIDRRGNQHQFRIELIEEILLRTSGRQTEQESPQATPD